MVENGTNSIAVVGAAGFVGRALLRELQTRGVRATAIVRGASELSIEGSFHRATAPTSPHDGFATVVNLAYPNSGPPYGHLKQNAEIIRMVSGLLRDGGRLVHVSTLAVFGATLDRPVRLGPVERVRDDAYVESKIAAEAAFVRAQSQRGFRLDIVRLGNVIGTGSGAWGVPIVHRLLTGRPVGIDGCDGWSNATDVANVASYLARLVEGEGVATDVRFHHLAEFAAVRWREWIEPIAEAMSVEPVYASPSLAQMPASWRQELEDGLASARPRSIYRNLVGERVVGSWSRSLLRTLPAPVFAKAKGRDLVFAHQPALPRSEQTFLRIMAAAQQFESVVDADWCPPLTRQESLDGLLRWLARG